MVKVKTVEALLDVEEKYIEHGKQYDVIEKVVGSDGFYFYRVNTENGEQQVPFEYFTEVDWKEI